METGVFKDKSKLSRFELIFLIAAATVTITFVSTCSPLYPFNPWDDTNCFFTVGRGIIHGLVPYRDLYEQKGPLLYFLYALAALVSEKSFIGAWIIECIAASVYAVYSWKIVRLFVETTKYSISLMPLFLGVTYTVEMFNFGGNAEELCFPFLTIALYIGFRAIIINGLLPSNTEAVLCGVITASLFWIKYTFVGFMLGFVLCILFLAIKHKQMKVLWSLVWRFTIGFLIISVPILIYFLATNSLSYLWEGYFYNNIFLYHNDTVTEGLIGIPVVKNIYLPIVTTLITLFNNYSFAALFILSFFSIFFLGKKQRLKTCILLIVTLALAEGFIFSRTSYIYYYGYILSYFFGMSLIPVIKLMNKLDNVSADHPERLKGLLAGLFAVAYVISIVLCKNLYLIFKPKSYLTQFRIAETINQTSDAKVLTYDVMDCGFYTSAGILPCNRFFCFLNIEDSYTDILDEQNRLIQEGYFDYIITSYFYESNWDNYELVQEEIGEYVTYDKTPILEGNKLYKRIST